ncbi:hypothetical protein HDU83_007065 [Entophlyctis luteolus]|nr:hypothetical protein HDU83_007065 [Entophlyctis luteolus]
MSQAPAASTVAARAAVSSSLLPSSSSASSSLLHFNPSSDAAFAHRIHVPPPKRADVVLEEDEYLDHMSHIIERDFFPDLKKLKTQNSFLAAVEVGDLAQAKALGEELHRLATGRRTPQTAASGSSTPLISGRAAAEDSSSSNGSRMATPVVHMENILDTSLRSSETGPATDEPRESPRNLSLDSFQQRYISEDNESFAKIIERENEARKRKYVWYFDKERKGKLMLEDDRGDSEGRSDELLLEDGSSGASTSSSSKNLLMLAPVENDMKTVQTWKYKTKNALMYYQPAAAQTLHDVISKPHAKLPPKSINHSATRLGSEQTSASSGASATAAAAAAAAAARLETQEVWRNIAAATPALFPNGAAANASGTSSFVPSTPSLEPHADVDPEDLMTWGMIEGTPILVDAGAGGASAEDAKAFRIPDTPRRDVLAGRLAEKARRDMKLRAEGRSSSSISGSDRKIDGFKKPMPVTSTAARLASPALSARLLSPAAQKLAGKLGGSLAAVVATNGSRKAAASGERGIDMQLRSSYSPAVLSATSKGGRGHGQQARVTSAASLAPSPMVKTPAMNPLRKAVGTPVVVDPTASSVGSAKRPALIQPQISTLTDNLLDF